MFGEPFELLKQVFLNGIVEKAEIDFSQVKMQRVLPSFPVSEFCRQV